VSAEGNPRPFTAGAVRSGSTSTPRRSGVELEPKRGGRDPCLRPLHGGPWSWTKPPPPVANIDWPAPRLAGRPSELSNPLLARIPSSSGPGGWAGRIPR
jgi:hypothetical protein